MNALYLISLGSNIRHPHYGAPPCVLEAALEYLSDEGFAVIARSATIASTPIGPSQRRFANGAAVVKTPLAPPDVLHALQAIESAFGRQKRGQAWRARVLDIDIVLWSGGVWRSKALHIPHQHMHTRPFVLNPAAQIAGHWRDPRSGLTLRQLAARLAKKKRAQPIHGRASNL